MADTMYYDIEQYKLITQTSHISFSYAPGKFNTWQLFNCQCSVNYAACNFDFKSAGIASINASTSSSIFSSDKSICSASRVLNI